MSPKAILISCALAAAVVAGAVWYLAGLTISRSHPVIIKPSKEDINALNYRRQLECTASLPLEVKFGQKIIAAAYAGNIDETTAAFAQKSIGGVIIMDEVPAAAIKAFRDSMPTTPFVAVDQEGGTVQRYKSWGALPGAETTAIASTPDQAYEQYLLESKRLKEVGITTNFAPVVDVASRTPNPLPGRMYSNNPAVVTDFASKAIIAAFDAGITPVIKHFPGLGSATGNTDFIAATTDTLSSLEGRDLAPYVSLASLHPDVMVGNMVVPDLTNGQPAIWSPEAISLLRSHGYEKAVLYTDSLTAEAITGPEAEAAVKAWIAGVDVAVIVQEDAENAYLNDFFETIIQQGLGAIDDKSIAAANLNESTLRILSRKQIDPCSLKNVYQ